MKSIYRVDLNNLYGEVHFDFKDYNEMMNFLGTALEAGHKDGEKLRATVSVISEEVGLDE